MSFDSAQYFDFSSGLDDDQITLEPVLFAFTRSFNASWIMQMSNNKLSNY